MIHTKNICDTHFVDMSQTEKSNCINADSTSFVAIKYLGFKLVDAVFRSVNLGLDDTFDYLATYCILRWSSPRKAFELFPKNIINCSLNFPRKKDQIEEKEYRRLYNQVRELYPCPEEESERSSTGVCLGSSLDFIANFFDVHKTQSDVYECIKTVSVKYREGSPPRAEILQRLYSGMGGKGPNSVFYQFNDKQIKFEMCCEEIERISLENLKMQLINFVIENNCNTDDEKYVVFQKELFNVVKERSQQLVKCVQDNQESTLRITNELRQRRIAAVASLVGLRINRIFAHEYDQVSPKSIDALNEHVQALDNGCYLIALQRDSGHAITMIKESKERTFLFEPNLATLVLNGEKELSKIFFEVVNYTMDAPITVTCYKVHPI